MNIGIVGLGLIGGSMAKSTKARTGHTVWGADLDKETMTMARMCGAIDAPLTDDNLPQCDLILVAIRPAAAVYLRGIRCVQLPTTLLSAVDSSVGGKTAVDLSAGKNLAGAFFQPAAVLCDTDCLSTLPPEILADGAAEAIKTGVLCDESLFSLFESGSLNLPEIITRCVSYKAGVVERDPTEQGERKLLNLGHTVGHAIERCSGFAIPHGHAVAAGLAIMARAAETRGWTDGPLAERITACLAQNKLPTGTDYSAEALAQAALSDKKRAGDTITVVVPRQIGVCELRKLPVSQLQSLIAAGLEV